MSKADLILLLHDELLDDEQHFISTFCLSKNDVKLCILSYVTCSTLTRIGALYSAILGAVIKIQEGRNIFQRFTEDYMLHSTLDVTLQIRSITHFC